MPPTFVLLAAIAAAATVPAWRFWPCRESATGEHEIENLSEDHPHISDVVHVGASFRHCYVYEVDTRHPEWPQPDRASSGNEEP